MLLKRSEAVSGLLKAIAHPARLKVLCCLIDSEKTVMEITAFCGVSQSATSQFLGRLKKEGLLTSRKEHQFVYYSLADQRLVRLLRAIKEIYC